MNTSESGEHNNVSKIGLASEVSERTLGFILGAFGLVAGLAWNDAVKALIEHLFPVPQDTLPAKFVYAIIISLLVVMVSIYLSRLIQKNEK